MYPEKLLRGIPNENYIDRDGPSAHLFYFNKMIDGKKDSSPLKRDDGFYEESISWLDEEEAIQLLLNQKKENKEGKEENNLQFKSGAVVLIRKQLDLIRITANISDKFQYERRTLDCNKYHGNLLCHSDISVQRMKQIAASIALLCVEKIVQPTNAEF